MSDVERSTAIDLSLVGAGVIWEKTLPDCFIRVASFAFRMSLWHRFQCKQRAIAGRVERAHRTRDVRQPWRRRFVFERFRRRPLRPRQPTDIEQAHAVEHIPYSPG